jgi:hypothetical protein
MTPCRLLFLLLAFALLCHVAASSAQDKKTDQPKTRVLTNKAKDIWVVSDREETVVKFFQRQHLLVGIMLAEEYKKLIAANKTRDKVFVSYASYNDDEKKEALFGATIKLAAPTPAAANLLKDRQADADDKDKTSFNLILRRDATDQDLYHVVGLTGRTSVGFFSRDKREGGDDFTQQDLRFKK